ncbi:MAG: PqqD family protein [Actinomycetota bacterium]|nr:PqqD family protein [Actinomycetota bacterium]
MRINDQIIAKEIQGELVLLNKKNGDYFSLNKVGTDIFNCINNNMDTESIINSLVGKVRCGLPPAKKRCYLPDIRDAKKRDSNITFE